MATTIVTKSGSGAPTASDLVAGELAVDLTNKRLYTEDSGGTVLELGTNPASDVTFGDSTKAIFGAGSDLQIYSDGTTGQVTGNVNVTGTVTADGLTVDGNPVINGTSPQLFLQTGASNTNWQIAAQENVANAFEISSGAADASAPDDTYTKRLVVQNNGDISFYEDTGTTPKFFWDASAESLGIGTSSIDGTLHVHTASAGTVTASSQADDLVIENSAEGGMTIITPDDQSARIRFTSPSTTADVGGASIFYRQNINKMSMGTEVAGGILALKSGAGSEGLLLDASGTTTFTKSGGGNIRIAETASRYTEIFGYAEGTADGSTMTFHTIQSGTSTSTERMRIDSAGGLLVGLSSGKDALIHAQAPKTTYTDYATVFAGGTDSNNGQHAISLMTSGNSLAGIIGSNLSIDGSSFSQPNTGRSSGYISFSNSTTAGKTSSITFGGLIKGTATALPKMTLDLDGNLLVGKTAATFSVNGVALGATGLDANGWNSFVTATPTASGGVQALNRKSSDGIIQGFFKDGTSVGSISAGALSGGINPIAIGHTTSGLWFIPAAGAIAPFNMSTNVGSDNAIDFGYSSLRWNDIYATNGTIQTSDRNEKQDIEALTDAEQRVAVAAKGLLRKFRWISNVEEKGDKARIHFGIIAQDLQAAFEAEGLDAGRYAMFINSTWTDEETGEERSRMGVRYSELLAFIIAAI